MKDFVFALQFKSSAFDEKFHFSGDGKKLLTGKLQMRKTL